MMAKTHVVIGTTYAMGLLPAVQQGQYTPTQFGLVLCGIVIGSLLPDLDHPTSVISQQIPLVGGIISRLTRHRGLLHSVLGVVLLVFILGSLLGTVANILTSTGVRQAEMITQYFLAGLVIGYILHIVADLLTVNGVRLLYPLRWKIRIGMFRTNGMSEMILRGILTAIVILQLVSVSQAQVEDVNRSMFRECLDTHNYIAEPVNVLWRGSVSWIESTISSEMIQSTMDLAGVPVSWDSENGAELPDVSRIRNGTETIGVTLEDGTVIRFIFNGWHSGYYYGWLTDSTQRHGASYNADKQPHARCGFWKVRDDDVKILRTLFYQITIRDVFEATMR